MNDSRTLRLRRHLGLTQAAFAKLIRQTQSTVVRLEAGKRETGLQRFMLDHIETDIAEGRLVAAIRSCAPAPEEAQHPATEDAQP